MSYVVEFANRSELLEAITILPEELGSEIDFKHGQLEFVRTAESLITRSYAIFGYREQLGGFVTEEITLPDPPTTEEAARMTQLLTKGVIPGKVIVSTLEEGKRFIRLFTEKLLPYLLEGEYQLESAELGIVGPQTFNGERWGPREWGIGTMNLVVKGNLIFDLDTNYQILPLMSVESGAVNGWFTRMVETNKDRFLFVKAN